MVVLQAGDFSRNHRRSRDHVAIGECCFEMFREYFFQCGVAWGLHSTLLLALGIYHRFLGTICSSYVVFV